MEALPSLGRVSSICVTSVESFWMTGVSFGFVLAFTVNRTRPPVRSTGFPASSSTSSARVSEVPLTIVILFSPLEAAQPLIRSPSTPCRPESAR